MSVALVIQHETRMRRIILSSVASLALPYFYTGSSGSSCALIKGVGSDVHERLYTFEPI